MNLSEIAGHLKCCETILAESINVIYSAPEQTDFFGLSCGDKIVKSVSEASQSQCIGLHRPHDCYGVSFCGVGERLRDLWNWGILQFPFGRYDNPISRGFPMVFQNYVNSSILAVPIGRFWSREKGAFHQNISSELALSRASSIADLNGNDAHEEQSNNRKRVAAQFVEELIDEIPVVAGVICGAIGITIYLNSRGVFWSFFGMSLLGLGVIFPWRMLFLLVL